MDRRTEWDNGGHEGTGKNEPEVSGMQVTEGRVNEAMNKGTVSAV